LQPLKIPLYKSAQNFKIAPELPLFLLSF